MATVRSVITGALQNLAVVGGVGRRSPTLTEFADALPILLSMYRSLITSGAFGRMRDVIPRGDYVAGENQRVYRRCNDQQELLLPDVVSACGSVGYLWCADFEAAPTPAIPNTDYGTKRYGYHDRSPVRTIRDNAVVTLVDQSSGDMLEAIYDGQRKLWFTLNDLDTGEELDEANEWSVKRLNDALDLEAPLSHRDRNGLTAALAVLLADGYAAEVGQTTVLLAQQFRQALVTNYSTYRWDDCADTMCAPASAGCRIGLFAR